MFSKEKRLLFLTLIACNTAFATPEPHFNVQMENQSNKNIGISFQQNVGNVSLQPVLTDKTPLAAKELSEKYTVYFDPITTQDTFNIVFTGKKECTFNVAYFAPANPKINIVGPGCRGGGYRIIDGGHTLLLYVTEISLV